MLPAMFAQMFTVLLIFALEEGITHCKAATLDSNETSNTSTLVVVSPQPTNNCSKHSDCNPVLRNLLQLITGESEQDDPRRNLQERHAFQSLHRNPKIICIKARCQCGDDETQGRVFDPVDQICRRRCEVDEDCFNNGLKLVGRQMDPKVVQLEKNDPLTFLPGDDLNIVPQICAPDHLCRCPGSSQVDMLNQSRCIVDTPPLLATSLTICSIFILLTITAVPVWSMITNHRYYLRQKQILPSNRKN